MIPKHKFQVRHRSDVPNPLLFALKIHGKSILCSQFSSLTNEGGRLRRDTVLMRGKDFEIVPEPIWRALASWYGGAPALPRTVSLYIKSNAHACVYIAGDDIDKFAETTYYMCDCNLVYKINTTFRVGVGIM